MKTIDIINEVFEAQTKAEDLKNKQRKIALDYTRSIIRVFGFSVNELFSEQREYFRNGALSTCKKLFSENPQIPRKEFIAKAQALGINERTASTQHSRLKNASC